MNQRGVGTVGMSFLGLVMIAMILAAVQLSSRRHSEQQAGVADRLAAHNAMRDLVQMMRRGFDLFQTFGACPAGSTLRVLNGVNYCIPNGANSCIQHPLDMLPAGTPLANRPPRLCFDGGAPQPRSIVDLVQLDEVEEYELIVRNKQKLIPLIFSTQMAWAQNRPKPWFPDITAIMPIGYGSPSFGIAPAPSRLPNYQRVCALGRPCFVLRACVRLGRNCNVNEMARQAFMFD